MFPIKYRCSVHLARAAGFAKQHAAEIGSEKRPRTKNSIWVRLRYGSGATSATRVFVRFCVQKYERSGNEVCSR